MKNKLTVISWLLSVLFAACVFLPCLQFSFNDYAVNLFGIAGEFASRDRAGFELYPLFGYITFILLILAAFMQMYFLIKVNKQLETKGSYKVALVFTIISVVVFAGYLLLVNARSTYTLTVFPFILLACAIAFFVLSSRMLLTAQEK